MYQNSWQGSSKVPSSFRGLALLINAKYLSIPVIGCSPSIFPACLGLRMLLLYCNSLRTKYAVHGYAIIGIQGVVEDDVDEMSLFELILPLPSRHLRK